MLEAALKNLTLDKPAISPVLVDTTSKLEDCLRDLAEDTNKPLAVDLEGNELGRLGTLSILQIYPRDGQTIYLIDITTLKKEAFDYKVDGCASLREILSGERRKTIYDVRNDSNALFFHYHITLGGAFDLQLLELALRTIAGDSTRLLHGLAKTLAKYLTLPREWTRIKDAGVKLFASELGGDGSIWDKRPLKQELITYSAHDVALIFDLSDKMRARIPERQQKVLDSRILREAVNRVKEAQDPRWVGRCRQRALAPARAWGI